MKVLLTILSLLLVDQLSAQHRAIIVECFRLGIDHQNIAIRHKASAGER
jgi:hypothetical protein